MKRYTPPRHLAEVRKKQGFTQRRLAKECGWNTMIISSYEQGTRSPNLEKLQKIADILGVTVSDLV